MWANNVAAHSNRNPYICKHGKKNTLAIWYHQLSWKRKLATVKHFKDDFRALALRQISSNLRGISKYLLISYIHRYWIIFQYLCRREPNTSSMQTVAYSWTTISYFDFLSIFSPLPCQLNYYRRSTAERQKLTYMRTRNYLVKSTKWQVRAMAIEDDS